METTANLKLPYILPSQAQKHVTHNEALRALDALVQLSVVGRDATVPPDDPLEGERHIVGSQPQEAWSGHPREIAVFRDGGWAFYTPLPGWVAFILADNFLAVFDGMEWVPLSTGAAGAADKIGVNTAADEKNRLAVKSDAVLFSHDDVTPGSGDIHATLNKAAAGRDAGLVFQTGWSTRALSGLFGDDDWKVKVSPDGATFFDGIAVDKDDGTAKFPSGIRDPNSGQLTTSLIPAVVKDIWRINVDTPSGTPRTYTIATVNGSVIFLRGNHAEGIFSADMRNVSMVRIWNISKSPAQSAWVNWNNAANQINVANAADIASWSAGETIRLGDPNPTGTNVLQLIALDISNYMYNNYGKVWRQRGLLFANNVTGVGGPARMNYSGSGATGTAFGSASNTDGSLQTAMLSVFTTEKSPISNSNLLFVAEGITGTATALAATRLCRLVGIYV
ncbi:hypothetical protein ATN84_00565 [Paramesorhizobium deserti]|uniref:DUF2793 domain-containing protein n=1 Tax=Paramesorhizobium deserti TaxID=1494590 RepID=A0A135HYT5_9HYPH|nr:DUF2793 domain-containing protein [Paramesorhizobium deserti]KXF78331.1 hypothetical protein ATN84_00565 [Paramesorhizobium deserti]